VSVENSLKLLTAEFASQTPVLMVYVSHQRGRVAVIAHKIVESAWGKMQQYQEELNARETLYVTVIQ